MSLLFLLLYFLSLLIVWKFTMNLPYHQSRKVQSILGFILLFVFFGFRDLPILNDTAHYYGHYHEMLSDSYGLNHIFEYDPYERFEYGFQILERLLIRFVSKDPYTIIIFSSFVFTTCNVLLFKKYSQRVALALFLFFINIPQYSAIRQSFAVMLFYLAFEYLLRKKYICYMLIVVVAYLFHRSAMILFLFPFLNMLSINKRNISLLFVGSIVVSYMIFPLLQIFNKTDSIYYATAMERDTLPVGQAIIALLNIIMAVSIYFIWKRTPVISIPKPFVWSTVLTISLSIIAIPFGIISRYCSFFNPYLFLMFVYYIEHSGGNGIIQTDNYSATVEGKYYQISPQAWRILIFFILLNIVKFIIINLFKNEWSHLIPYSFYDFAPGIHNYDFGY